VATPASNPKRAIQFGCEPNQLQIPNNSWEIQHKTGIKKNSNKFFCSSKAARKRKQAEETQVIVQPASTFPEQSAEQKKKFLS
jgi:hypothetical protein